MLEAQNDTQIGQVTTRPLHPGEGSRPVAVAEDAGMPGLEDRKGPLQAVLNHNGGVFDLGVPDLPSATGWCVGAYRHDELIGMLYACSPVTFLRSFAAEHRAGLTRRLVEIEMLAVQHRHRGQGVGSALLGFVEEYFARQSVEYVLVKIDAAPRAQSATAACLGERPNRMPWAGTGSTGQSAASPRRGAIQSAARTPAGGPHQLRIRIRELSQPRTMRAKPRGGEADRQATPSDTARLDSAGHMRGLGGCPG